MRIYSRTYEPVGKWQARTHIAWDDPETGERRQEFESHVSYADAEAYRARRVEELQGDDLGGCGWAGPHAPSDGRPGTWQPPLVTICRNIDARHDNHYDGNVSTYTRRRVAGEW